VLALLPRHLDALNNRGNVLANLGRLEPALACFEQVLALKPDHLDALTNRGNALKALRRFDEALSSYERALALNPDHADAFNNRGNALQALRRYAEALASYDKALAIDPNHAGVQFNAARALQELELHDQAVSLLDAIIDKDPGNANALYSRGNSLVRLNRIAEAIADCERTLAVEPDHAHAYSALIRYRMLVCDWDRLAAAAGDLEWRLNDPNCVIEPFQPICLPTTPAQQLSYAQRYVHHKVGDTPAPLWRPGVRHRHKIRIGYFSADFRAHAVAAVIARLFELHDRAQFEVIGISFGPDDGSELRSRIATAFDQFHDVRFRSDREVATMMHDLEIDIAVDLTGHTAHSRTEVLAYRPCPVQVSYLGYPGTTEAAFIDYVIADETALPFDQQPFFAERIVHLPDCYLPHDSRLRPVPAEAPARTALGLPERGLVFCAFTNSYKITAPVFVVWMRLLQSIPGSVLWLSQMNELAERNLRREAARRGIDPERLIFAPRLDSFEDHLARHRQADLYLDTLPYNAHSTAANALWAGLPVLTCAGGSFAGRVRACCAPQGSPSW
jgi:protein O-GlcNAc transferase